MIEQRQALTGKHLSNGYPDDVKVRALAILTNSSSVADAHRTLTAQMQAENLAPIPAYWTLWQWSREHGALIDSLTLEQKRELIAMSSEVVAVAAGHAIEAMPDLNPYQKVIAYGIAADKRIAWENAGRQAGPTFNLRVRLATSDERSPVLDEPDIVEGTATRLPVEGDGTR